MHMGEEGFVISDAVTSSSAVTVYGMVVGQIFTVKTSINTGVPYFNSSFTDGTYGFVGFQAS